MKWLLPLIALCLGLLGGWFLSGSPDADVFKQTGSATANKSSGQSRGKASSESALDASKLTKAEQATMDSVGMTSEWLESLEEMDELDQLSALLERLKR